VVDTHPSHCAGRAGVRRPAVPPTAAATVVPVAAQRLGNGHVGQPRRFKHLDGATFHDVQLPSSWHASPARCHGFCLTSCRLLRPESCRFSKLEFTLRRQTAEELETENTRLRLKKLLAESLLENEVIREALRRKW